MGHYISCITLVIPFVSVLPSATSLSYQQLHQQVDQCHTQVCFRAMKHTPPHIFKVSVLNSQLAEGCCACELRSWLLCCAWGLFIGVQHAAVLNQQSDKMKEY